MKKLLIVSVLLLVLLFSLASCGKIFRKKGNDITVEDGYLVVNGEKTEHEVKTEDKVEIVDGYLVVNGVKTEHKIDTADVITVEDGYLVVNGVKTEYLVAIGCNHVWTTVTTEPTCSEVGYDTMTCPLCDKSVRVNEIATIDHTFEDTYSFDNDAHWYPCAVCGAPKDKENHTLDEEGVCTVCLLPITPTPGVIYEPSADGTYAEVFGYTGTVAKVKIAEEYNGLPVKTIYNYAFEKNTTITSVIIPDGVTNIGTCSFYNCSSLTSVVIPDSVTSIGSSAFYDCRSMTSVVIGDSVTFIDSRVFYRCSKLSYVVIGESVTSIGYEAFMSSPCTSVVIHDSLMNIAQDAFYATGVADVYYTGSAAEWHSIKIGAYNNPLTNANIHYNYVPEA